MAKNDIVLVDSLVSKARARLADHLDDSEVFELFCFEQLLKNYELTDEEVQSGWTDGTNDGGVDGFYVLVDGRLLEPDDALAHSARQSPEIHVVLFTVKRTDSFQQEPLNTLHGSLLELFDLRKRDEDLTYPFSEDVRLQRDLFRQIFVGLADRRPHLRISIHYCSRGDTSTLADNLTTRAEQLGRLVKGLFSGVNVDVTFQGAAELLEIARRQPTYSLKLRFTESYISREGRNYVVLALLPDFYSFISDDSGELRRYLFDSNVRDYLGEVLINQDIRRTLDRRSPPDTEDFWWLNNGVTILATHATVAGKELHLENVQIVNGLQSTETMFEYFRSGGTMNDNRAILIKVLLTSDEDTRSRIIKATNYQNTVELSSLRGLDKFQRDIDHFLADHGWFYDRRKNFYKNQGKPADRIVSVPYLAAAVRAVALREPARSQRQRSKSLRDDAVYSQIFKPKWDLRVYLASLEITRAVEFALHGRRTIFESPPIALVHYVSFVYTCAQLGTNAYEPFDVARLAGLTPNEASVFAIRDELVKATNASVIQGRRFGGIVLNKTLFERFVEEHYGAPARLL